MGLQDVITEMVHEAKKAIRRLPEEVQAQANAQAVLTGDWRTWFLTCGELTFSNPVMPDGGRWEEALHNDGGASVMHMGITVYGRRLLRCVQGDGPSWEEGGGIVGNASL